MSENKHSDIFTIGIGGAAGDGVKKAGIKIGQFLCSLGYEVYLSMDYPSLIKGGHNFVRLSCKAAANNGDFKEKVWSDHTKLDLLIVSNEESKNIHKEELKEGAKIISDILLPKISENPKIIFADFADMLSAKNKLSEPEAELIDGNTAFAKGLLAAGLDFYFAYPMTPATSILHFLAGRQANGKLKVIQPENEISVINMALGAAYAGKRSAVGTATGGFALMQEAFSFAGIAELPLAIAVSQRQAPATGAPTHSSQSDLQFVLHSGHGEFPRIVIAPGDPEESFRAGAGALNLSWKFQIPAVVLLDKILSEHMMSGRLDEKSISVEKGKISDAPGEQYARYKITDDGVSPMAFPGTVGAAIKATSYEHNESGASADDPIKIKEMIDKRFRKEAGIKSEMKNSEAIKIYGDPASENVIVFWGSTKGAVLEASRYFKKPVKLLQVLWMEPFDGERFLKEINGAKRIIGIEANHSGQLISLIKEKTGFGITENILKYDSRPFDPEELAVKINSMI